VDQLGTHGGSLRLHVCHADDSRGEDHGLLAVRAQEVEAGMGEPGTYVGFAARVEAVKAGLRQFLADAGTQNKTVVAYGAAAKGNTLLNAAGITTQQILFAVDRSPHKQGLLLPGSRIPIQGPEQVKTARPDYVLVLPWNLADEIMEQLAYIREWGGRFVTAIPDLRISA
jgi:predicted glycosyltransferase